MTPATRKLLSVTRTLHIYLTMLAMIGMTTFAVTGIILNHRSTFGLDDAEPSNWQIENLTGTLPTGMLRQPDSLAVVEHLRSEFAIAGAVTDFEIEDEALYISFARPGYKASAFIDRNSGDTEVTKTAGGFVAVITALHKGDHADGWWKFLMDVAAGLFILAVLSGLVLWLSIPRRRRLGLIALLLGLGTWVLAYSLATL